MTTTPSPHPEKIALADLDAVVAQDAVGGGGVEIEIRKRKAAGKLLALQRHGIARASREGDVFAIGAVELRRLERFDVVDGFGEPLPQFVKGLFGVGRRRHIAVGEPRAALAAKSQASWICLENGSMSG